MPSGDNYQFEETVLYLAEGGHPSQVTEHSVL